MKLFTFVTIVWRSIWSWISWISSHSRCALYIEKIYQCHEKSFWNLHLILVVPVHLKSLESLVDLSNPTRQNSIFNFQKIVFFIITYGDTRTSRWARITSWSWYNTTESDRFSWFTLIDTIAINKMNKISPKENDTHSFTISTRNTRSTR